VQIYQALPGLESKGNQRNVCPDGALGAKQFLFRLKSVDRQTGFPAAIIYGSGNF
jgi:hypothetical protein